MGGPKLTDGILRDLTIRGHFSLGSHAARAKVILSITSSILDEGVERAFSLLAKLEAVEEGRMRSSYMI